MAQGKGFDESVRQKAVTLVASGMSVKDAASRVGAGESTVRGWLASIKRDDPEALAKLRAEKKAAFASRAWADCEASLRLISRRIEAAARDLDALEDLIEEATRDEDITRDERAALLRKLSHIRVDDIGKLATVMGILYDKSELASGGPTERIDMTRFEDI